MNSLEVQDGSGIFTYYCTDIQKFSTQIVNTVQQVTGEVVLQLNFNSNIRSG